MADAEGEQAEPQQAERSEESSKELTEEELEGDEALCACLIVCGLNEQQQNDAVLGKGFLDLISFCSMNCSSLSKMVKHIGRLRRNTVRIGKYHLRNMEALAWWIHDQRCCNREIYAEEFDVEIMEACLNELELESKEEMDEEIMLSKFKDTLLVIFNGRLN
jgi:hypothetical protein